ncbi:DUF1361 domain-containing protein [Okeania sp. SIO1I7]|uniref:DUF1361 domain-containing protein n=1 Tax=Okeania sp. SIO1I7 TaxID=2607772 RepID=UPI0013FA6E0E|nr:DUF1361 domain-containing protein [Okeania sp. SIO1I7]NET25329.1 DUF1361 domain-containing protein [Okeania sp. SIO1I7]
MKAEIINAINTAWQFLEGNSRFMSWNLFLALFPLAMSFWLFSKPRSIFIRWGVLLLLGATLLPNINRVVAYGNKLNIEVAIAITLVLIILGICLLRRPQYFSLLWWFGLLIFIAFLPNAPYVLTDIIHLYQDIRQSNSVWVLTLAVVPQYLLFMFIGFEAYVLSLINLGYYLHRQGWSNFILGIELIIHCLSAIGIYLGRFKRFNSWDVVTNPDALVKSVYNDMFDLGPILVIFITFIVIFGLYWLMKLVTLALLQQYQINQEESEKISRASPKF